MSKGTRRLISNKRMRRLLMNHTAAGGMIFLLVVGFFALAGPQLLSSDPYAMSLQNRMAPPSWSHPFGRDNFGRDMMARMIAGSRVSLTVGLLAIVFASFVGTALGVAAGYYGKWVDSLVMRAVDTFLSFPAILLALALVAVLGASVQNLIIALTAIFWTRFARVVRGVVLVVKGREFVEAARAIGASSIRIVLHHVVPNCLAEVTVISTLDLGQAIVAEASLSFLGLGIQPPTPSWGEALSVGVGFLRESPHMVIVPGMMIFVTVLAVNLLGDGLRDAFDPRMGG